MFMIGHREKRQVWWGLMQIDINIKFVSVHFSLCLCGALILIQTENWRAINISSNIMIGDFPCLSHYHYINTWLDGVFKIKRTYNSVEWAMIIRNT